MIDDDRSTDDYQQQRLACVSRIASRVRWIESSRMDRVESVGSSRVESRICVHALVQRWTYRSSLVARGKKKVTKTSCLFRHVPDTVTLSNITVGYVSYS
jgi:hypothetical protein